MPSFPERNNKIFNNKVELKFNGASIVDFEQVNGGWVTYP